MVSVRRFSSFIFWNRPASKTKSRVMRKVETLRPNLMPPIRPLPNPGSANRPAPGNHCHPAKSTVLSAESTDGPTSKGRSCSASPTPQLRGVCIALRRNTLRPLPPDHRLEGALRLRQTLRSVPTTKHPSRGLLNYGNKTMNRSKTTAASLLALALLLVLTTVGCGRTTGADVERSVLQNKGSDTLVNVAQAWAENYKRHRSECCSRRHRRRFRNRHFSDDQRYRRHRQRQP